MISAFGVEHGEVSKAYVPLKPLTGGKELLAGAAKKKPGFQGTTPKPPAPGRFGHAKSGQSRLRTGF